MADDAAKGGEDVLATAKKLLIAVILVTAMVWIAPPLLNLNIDSEPEIKGDASTDGSECKQGASFDMAKCIHYGNYQTELIMKSVFDGLKMALLVVTIISVIILRMRTTHVQYG